MNMNVKKTFSAVSAAIALCCGVFAGTAIAQSDDLWGDYNSSSTTEMSMPESDTPAGWEPLSDLDEPAAKNKPAKAAKSKPEKTPKAAKAPKPAKETKPKAAPVGEEDRTLNVFVNTGWGFGIGGHLLREVSATGTGNGPTVNENKDYYLHMGKGLKFEVGAGYMAMPNLETRFSVDFNFGLGAPTIKERIFNDATTPLEIIRDEKVDYKSLFSWGVRVMAVPQFEMLELIDMYLGAGLSLNFASGTIDTTFNYQDGTYDNTVYDMQFVPAMGFCGLVGFVYPLSEMTDFFGELQFESKSFTLRTEKLKSNYRKPGSTISQPDGEITYEENKGGALRAPPKYSGSNWGIRAGLRFWFAL
jgi:hypothetical protein